MAPIVRFLLSFFLASTAAACTGKQAAEGTGGDTAEFPPIYGKTLDGEYLHIRDLEARAVLVNVWATWCAPCRKELPTLEKIHRTYRDRGLAVLGVSVDGAGDRGAVASMVKSFGLTYPIVLDPSAKVTTVLGVSGYPASFLFDGQGRQLWRRDGMIFEEDAELASQLAAALGPAAP
ncbi:MAG: TlpA family protein disulfide reductase [Deltaproteobacteria bacterium]|nr:MAG: TlpA family protein disulfide reductase [Deltaproteobacteria bacterium]